MAEPKLSGDDLRFPYSEEEYDGDTIMVNSPRRNLIPPATDTTGAADNPHPAPPITTPDQESLNIGAITLEEASAVPEDTIMTTPHSAQHTPKLSACLTCRKRKVGCDRVRPVCDRCTKDTRECIYSEHQHGAGQSVSSQQQAYETIESNQTKKTSKFIASEKDPIQPTRRSARMAGKASVQDDASTTRDNEVAENTGVLGPVKAPEDVEMADEMTGVAPDARSTNNLPQDPHVALFDFMARQRANMAANLISLSAARLQGISERLEAGPITNLSKELRYAFEPLLDWQTGECLSCEEGLLSEEEVRTWRRDFGMESEEEEKDGEDRGEEGDEEGCTMGNKEEGQGGDKKDKEGDMGHEEGNKEHDEDEFKEKEMKD